MFKTDSLSREMRPGADRGRFGADVRLLAATGADRARETRDPLSSLRETILISSKIFMLHKSEQVLFNRTVAVTSIATDGSICLHGVTAQNKERHECRHRKPRQNPWIGAPNEISRILLV
jgi:hypothetical protein